LAARKVDSPPLVIHPRLLARRSLDTLTRARGWLRNGPPDSRRGGPGEPARTPNPVKPPLGGPQPIVSPERLVAAAEHLAAGHEVTLYARAGRSLRVRLDAAARYLTVAHADMRRRSQASRSPAGQGIPDFMPGAEWLLDNFYVIADQITEVRVDLPERYYTELPKLLRGPLEGYPRIYALARALVAYTDGALTQERITGFVAAYQTAAPSDAPLTLGELWSVPIMLRLSLLETLAHLVSNGRRIHWQAEAADDWADRLLDEADAHPGAHVGVPEALANSAALDEPSFTARLYSRLRDQGPDLAYVVQWLDTYMAAAGTTAEEMLRRDHQRQAANATAIGNAITSMRRISAIEWPGFVEGLSTTEARMHRDPAEVYGRMDFATRDRYRHVIERIARRARRLEGAVADTVVAKATSAADRDGLTARAAHLGYYLIGEGRPELEKAVGYRPTPVERIGRLIGRHATPFYVGLVAGTTGALVAGAVAYARRHDRRLRTLLGTAAVTAIPASDLAVSLVNHLITTVMEPYTLPKLEFEAGIPPEARTFVVIPVLLSDEQQLRELLDHLQVLYLSNHDPHLHYALLSDFPDAANEDEPGDAALLREAIAGIEVLNARHGGDDRFYLFHRRRRWNLQEGRWMGWERKRGKLIEFNRLLRNTGGADFTTRVGDLGILPDVRYVITLDADTQLPPEAAQRLAGTLAHPLNRAEWNAAGVVTRGYGLLQPRVAVTATSAAASPFARVFAGHTGVDPYTTAVSDVYQDLFHRGIYIGKGIYDVDAFAASVDGRFPPNTLLSHDLLEGSYARAGLASDILLYEDHPARYPVYALRQDRWIRGDWQILEWLLPRVRNARGLRVPNPLPPLPRWQIFDNLRRSLDSPAILLLLAAGWRALPGSPVVWTLAASVVRAFPALAGLVSGLPRKPPGTPWRRHFTFLVHETQINAVHHALRTALLPHQTLVHLAAIGKALGRMYVTHRDLLAWQTAADAQRSTGNTLPDYLRHIAPAALLGVSAGALGRRAWIAWPFAAAWAVAPWIAYRISQPTQRATRPLTADEVAFLRRAARKTWRYFETFVGPDDHWLAPDNYQEVPQGTLARRTSPTNLSLALLATLAARDFGYLSTGAMAARLDLQLTGLEGLERFQGHLYNWYDTATGAPLQPRYISMVDSGNLAAHLLVLKHGCLAQAEAPLLAPGDLAGLRDTAALLREELAHLAGRRGAADPALQAVHTALAALDAALATPSAPLEGDLAAWVARWAQLAADAAAVADAVEAVPRAPQTEDLRYWAAGLVVQTRATQADIDTLLPWVARLAEVPPAIAAPVRAAFGVPPEATIAVPSPAANLTWCAHHVPVIRRLRAALRTMDLAPADQQAAQTWLDDLHDAIAQAWTASEALTRHLREIARRAEVLTTGMRFGFLYDPERKLFTIGYNVTEGRRDSSYYDLLASEARLGSYLAVARGDIPPEHWFHLGRAITQVDGTQALVSWSGTMFEYLMPNLVMPVYPATLLDQTSLAVVEEQRRYAGQRGVPWGISESAYNVMDAGHTYQYRAFGVPGLGLKRGLDEDLVIAPYATMLALSVDPSAAIANLHRLTAAGAEGRYGYYEAIDYTPGRAVRDPRRATDGPGRPAQTDSKGAIVRTFMVHHQGMSLLAMDNALHDYPLVDRFLAEPVVEATELLLQERIPWQAPLTHPEGAPVAPLRSRRWPAEPELPGDDVIRFATPDTLRPMPHLLSNGAYTVMLTNAGGGFSQWRGRGGTPILVTRWRDDVTRDAWGTFLYLRDVREDHVWSAGYTPVGGRAGGYGGEWTPDHGVIWRRDYDIESNLTVVVSPDEDVEVRRLRLTNRSTRPREIEITSYAEVVLAAPSADLAHPAFQKLFVETEFVPDFEALLATRRPRAADEVHPWLVHVVASEGDIRGAIEYETDRARFLGRGHSPARPAALLEPGPLSGTTGAVLDPIVCLRRRVRLAPGETARFHFATGIAESRAAALNLAERYQDAAGATRVARLAVTYSQLQLSGRNLTPAAAMRAIRLAGRVIFPSPAMRPPAAVLARNTEGQPALWAYGISGDLPILLVVLSDPDQAGLMQEAVQAHDYWRSLGFAADLVILNEYAEGYIQNVQDELTALLQRGPAAGRIDQPGGVFLRRAEAIPEADRILLQTAARAILIGRRGSIARQLARAARQEEPASSPLRDPRRGAPAPGPDRRRSRHPLPYPTATTTAPGAGGAPLEFDNGLGGFSADGREYVIRLRAGEWTPAPWINVLANPEFGTLVSESTLGTTWWLNSRENRLTPWSNDPISDTPGDILYLRDEDRGGLWSPTPLAIRGSAPYTIRHGHGYTVYEHTGHGIDGELTVFVPPDLPLRLLRLRLRNPGGTARRLSVTNYVEWVLGVDRAPSARFVITAWDAEAAALTAHNPYNNEFADRLAFLALVARPDERRGTGGGATYTADRTAFLGRNGRPGAPAGLAAATLDGRTGAGLDPCGAIQAPLTVGPGATVEIVFALGETANAEAMRALLAQIRAPGAVDAAFAAAQREWAGLLSTVQVQTPDKALDLLLNGWLLYQALACRIWARSAFYQGGGAYGFRDQLQDVLALVYTAPQITRDQIVRAAGHQFAAGDVQHWWHPPTGRGVRTRFSDDLLWLPFVTAIYVEATGDTGVLDEVQPFLEAPPLAPGQEDAYSFPSTAPESGTVYEHCVRALTRGATAGPHDLPLMGSGDWNDGMNRVGIEGRGESVWVGWFLADVLRRFAPLAAARGDHDRAEWCRAQIARLQAAIHESAWDGAWYRRAYFDDGTPLGSHENEECCIDSIAQSWSVLSGIGDPARAQQAMAALEEHLIRPAESLVLLLTPPFDKSELDPGYIKGYVPGVRENGGQYTHAAIWVGFAFAELRDGVRAHALFNMLNPINHALDPDDRDRYKVEPYVIAADVYAHPQHVGRGGWTWYTGSAAWMYRLGVEAILGLRRVDGALCVDPAIPPGWPGFEVCYRHGAATYTIQVDNAAGRGHGVVAVTLDGAPCPDGRIPLDPAPGTHAVQVRLGPPGD
jgi:cellobiose phosphorylase